MLDILDKWKNKIAHYIDVRLRLLKLNFIAQTSGLLSHLIFVFILLFLVLAVLIFLGLGLSEWFVELFDSRIAAYFATCGVYILLMFILLAARRAMVNAFSGIFIRILTTQDKDDIEENDGDEEN